MVNRYLDHKELLNTTGEDREMVKGMLASKLTKEKNGLFFVVIDLFQVYLKDF